MADMKQEIETFIQNAAPDLREEIKRTHQNQQFRQRAFLVRRGMSYADALTLSDVELAAMVLAFIEFAPPMAAVPVRRG